MAGKARPRTQCLRYKRLLITAILPFLRRFSLSIFPLYPPIIIIGRGSSRLSVNAKLLRVLSQRDYSQKKLFVPFTHPWFLQFKTLTSNAIYISSISNHHYGSLLKPHEWFEVLRALLRILLNPFYYVILHLLVITTKIKHYIDHLGASRRIALCNYEKKKLLDAWSMSATSNVVFVTLEVRHREPQIAGISEIALSQWSPGILSKTEILLWTIENESCDAEVNHSASLLPHGTTKTIEADDVPLHLADAFQDLKEQYDRIYIVGYRINKTLDFINPIWEIPKDITTIDTEKVWQLQDHGDDELSFKQCIETIPQLQKYRDLLGNAGNETWLGIQLLKIELKAFHKGPRLHSLQ
ncbi:hypothetical protein F5Y08DRAFT_310730 [Xylaria arbuscula]|nr:hypothetical protein F5Y08DRAFT_310730 [Xylaria arbuscula]